MKFHTSVIRTARSHNHLEFLTQKFVNKMLDAQWC